MLTLPSLLRRIDAGVDVIAPGDLTPRTRRALTAAGLIRDTDWLDEIACNACATPHLEMVQRRTMPDGSMRAWIPCPEHGRVRIDLARLRRERVDVDALADHLARGLGCGGSVSCLIPGHLWVVGSRALVAEPWSIVLLRTPPDRDYRALLAHDGLRAHPRCAVVVVGTAPNPRDLPVPPPPLVPLAALVSDADGSLAVSDAALVALVRGDGRHRVAAAVASIPIPAGTRWGHIALTVDDHGLIASIGASRFPRTPADLDCINRTTGLPDEQWALLRQLASTLGSHRVLQRRAPAPLVKRVGRLRASLRALCPGVDGDPIPFDPEVRAFRTAFHIRAAGGALVSLPADGWNNVAIIWGGNSKLGIELPDERRRGIMASGNNEDAAADAAVDIATGRRVVDLAEVGLATATGQANRAGRALEALCRGRGRLVGRGDADAMLELGEALRRTFGTTDDPLTWLEKSGQWLAEFEARSHNSAHG